jgi:hypothetical protein
MLSRTKNFGDYETVKNKIALLNIGAYHSADVRSFGSLLALPSSRVSLGWAQEVLFPDAEAGKRVVICMRSASCWGLERGRKYGKSLFAPDCRQCLQPQVPDPFRRLFVDLFANDVCSNAVQWTNTMNAVLRPRRAIRLRRS